MVGTLGWSRARRGLRKLGASSQPYRLVLETLENRTLLSNFVVTNINDSGAGSLRAAILSANAHSGADSVRFDRGVVGTIGLTSQLSVTGDTDIKGPGTDLLTISGGGTTRVLSIAAGANVSVKGLTIANGSITGENGGGILNQGTLTLTESVITGNASMHTGCQYCFTPGGFGGGIANTGAITIKNSIITGNHASRRGGGLFDDRNGIATLDGSAITNNTCVGDGAGISTGYAPGTTVAITNSTIIGNVATGFGTGGVAQIGGKFTIEDTLIEDNASAAGAIYQ